MVKRKPKKPAGRPRRAAPRKRSAKKPAARKRAAKAPAGRTRPPAKRKFRRKRLSAAEELKINALIARVYQKAAEEMRRVEDATAQTKRKLFADAARELARMEN